jgi:hypothetical protein
MASKTGWKAALHNTLFFQPFPASNQLSFIQNPEEENGSLSHPFQIYPGVSLPPPPRAQTQRSLFNPVFPLKFFPLFSFHFFSSFPRVNGSGTNLINAIKILHPPPTYYSST